VIGDGRDVSTAFVTADKRELVIKRPISKPGVKVSVADSGVGDSDENFSRLELIGLNYGPVGLVHERPILLFKNDGVLGLGDVVVGG